MIAAGINLFGGPLGLIHRHVTGAIPIRRNTKDPAYLVTLKAYVAELLGRHDLLFYIEGGRSYSGELKAPKTGLLHAALTADRSASVIVPMAVAYDLVLEDRILAHQGTKRRLAAVRARGRGDGALRRRLPVARLRHLRRADRAQGLRPRIAARRHGARAPHARHDRPALQGAADRDRRRGDAARRSPGASSKRAPRRSSTRPRPPAATWRSPPGARPSSRRPNRSKPATSSTSNAADASASASAPCSATTPARCTTCSPDPRRTASHALMRSCRRLLFHALGRKQEHEDACVPVRHCAAHAASRAGSSPARRSPTPSPPRGSSKRPG